MKKKPFSLKTPIDFTPFLEEIAFIGQPLADDEWEDEKYAVLHRLFPVKHGPPSPLVTEFRRLLEADHAAKWAAMPAITQKVLDNPDYEKLSEEEQLDFLRACMNEFVPRDFKDFVEQTFYAEPDPPQ